MRTFAVLALLIGISCQVKSEQNENLHQDDLLNDDPKPYAPPTEYGLPPKPAEEYGLPPPEYYKAPVKPNVLVSALQPELPEFHPDFAPAPAPVPAPRPKPVFIRPQIFHLRQPNHQVQPQFAPAPVVRVSPVQPAEFPAMPPLLPLPPMPMMGDK